MYKISKLILLILTVLLTSQSLMARATYDFDGDGKSDPVVRRVENNRNFWYVNRSRDGFLAFQWGAISPTLEWEDVPVPEDYDGDGKWDFAVWRRRVFEEGQSYFYIHYSSTNTYQVIPWGLRHDYVIPQDYDGDGKADVAVARPTASGIIWYIMQSRDGFRAEHFGGGGFNVDRVVKGDYDGDGKADLAVYRRDESAPFRDYTFFIKRSSDGGLIVDRFGNARQDYAMPGDYDGDGKTDVAVWRGNSEFGNGTWYWHRSSDGGYGEIRWGAPISYNDDAAPGDYDGDGKTDVAVWRIGDTVCSPAVPSYFYINGSQNGFMAIQWGNSCFFNSLNQ
jgi:hypothetical protein